MSGGRAVAAVGLAALVASCATASRIENGRFYSPKGYSVQLPSGWRVAAGDADLDLWRASPSGGMLADATCAGRESARPLPVLSRHLLFGLTHPETVESDDRTINGWPASHRVMRGTVDGREVAVEAVVVKGDRCVHDFLYVAPVGEFEAGRAEFAAFVDSFAAGSAAR